MTAGEIIRLIRIVDGISQGELAKRLNVTNAYLSQIENGRKEPSLSLLKVFSEQTRVPLPLLMIDSGNAAEDEIMGDLRKLLQNFLAVRTTLPRTDRKTTT